MSSALQCELQSEPVETEKYVFTYPKIPIELADGKKAVISAWDTNVYILGDGAGGWSITEQFGPDLEEGREYLLICPKY